MPAGRRRLMLYELKRSALKISRQIPPIIFPFTSSQHLSPRLTHRSLRRCRRDDFAFSRRSWLSALHVDIYIASSPHRAALARNTRATHQNGVRRLVCAYQTRPNWASGRGILSWLPVRNQNRKRCTNKTLEISIISKIMCSFTNPLSRILVSSLTFQWTYLYLCPWIYFNQTFNRSSLFKFPFKGKKNTIVWQWFSMALLTVDI